VRKCVYVWLLTDRIDVWDVRYEWLLETGSLNGPNRKHRAPVSYYSPREKLPFAAKSSNTVNGVYLSISQALRRGKFQERQRAAGSHSCNVCD
jgi:hypothetical protein